MAGYLKKPFHGSQFFGTACIDVRKYASIHFLLWEVLGNAEEIHFNQEPKELETKPQPSLSKSSKNLVSW